MAFLSGLSAFPITPSDLNGRVDTAALKRLVARLCIAGVDSIGLLGSTGTYMYLSQEERRRALDAAIQEANGVPVVAGVGALRTDEAVRLAQDAKAAGAAAGLLAAVSYAPLTEDEVFEHFSTVARKSGLPIVIYDNPGTTHFRFTAVLVERLAHRAGVGLRQSNGWHRRITKALLYIVWALPRADRHRPACKRSCLHARCRDHRTYRGNSGDHGSLQDRPSCNSRGDVDDRTSVGVGHRLAVRAGITMPLEREPWSSRRLFWPVRSAGQQRQCCQWPLHELRSQSLRNDNRKRSTAWMVSNVRFKGLDLNLLVALDALMTERNLTVAARSINLSQPAMSAAVGRLREYFRDDLFTMNGRELCLTPRAEGLAPVVRDVLLKIRCSIISWEPFNPSQSERRFRILLSDFMTLVFLDRVIARVAREAPAVSFELLPLDNDPNELLRRGEVDFLLLPDLYMANSHPTAKLFDEKLVCVSCPTNNAVPQELTFEQYMSMGHVAVMFGRLLRPSIEEWYLLEHGIKRRLEVVVQGFSFIPQMLSGTNRIATMPLRLVEYFEKTIPLRIINLPLPLPAFTEAVQWPALHNGDPASIWMRQILIEEASRMAVSHNA